MFGLLLAVIYLAFISLGLPDSLLGSAWPVMHAAMDVPVSFAGIVTMIITGGTIASSLLSDRLTRKLGAGPVTAVSVLLTAAALFGFSASRSFPLLCLWAVPYGLGAGAVDAALNNYVALHCASRHMNWLHCFWGVGATLSPYIMGRCLAGPSGWPGGYRTVAILQTVLTAILFLSLPLWKKQTAGNAPDKLPGKALTLPQVLKLPGVKWMLAAFFAQCAFESTSGLWACSFLVQARGIAAADAAKDASLLFLGMTASRFLCGFVADALGDRKLIRIGLCTAAAGCVLLALPVRSAPLMLSGLLVIGLGCAPVYPSIIHATPANFGAEHSQAVIGVQMAGAYTGSALMPPLFGLLAAHTTVALLPFALLLFAGAAFFFTQRLNRLVADR